MRRINHIHIIKEGHEDTWPDDAKFLQILIDVI